MKIKPTWLSRDIEIILQLFLGETKPRRERHDPLGTPMGGVGLGSNLDLQEALAGALGRGHPGRGRGTGVVMVGGQVRVSADGLLTLSEPFFSCALI